jgi:hypothetical protein
MAKARLGMPVDDRPVVRPLPPVDVVRDDVECVRRLLPERLLANGTDDGLHAGGDEDERDRRRLGATPVEEGDKARVELDL